MFINQRKKILLIIAVGIIAALIYYFFSKYYPQDYLKGNFSESVYGLPDAKEAEVVHLKNGDKYELTAEYVTKDIGNKKIRMVGYNGSIPGPFINVEQGSNVTIRFKNNLNITTTIHSHGLRLDFANDGTPGISQKPILPGQIFEYHIKFPDSGTYWYHPHIREDYAMDLGLYGNYQVSPVPYHAPMVNEEINLILDDILIKNGEVVPHLRDKTDFALMGRFGNIMLVNGDTNYVRNFSSGEVVRINFTNVANVRPFELTIPGAKIKMVGSDMGLYENEFFTDNILITPSERYSVDVYFEKPGEYKLVHTSHDIAIGKTEYTMAKFNVEQNTLNKSYADDFNNLKNHPEITEEFSEVREFTYKKADKYLRIVLDPGKVDLGNAMDLLPCHKMPDGTWMGKCTDESKESWLKGLSPKEKQLGGESIHWEDHMYALNSKITNKDIKWQLKDDKTGELSPEITSWNFKLGDRVKVRIFNDPMSVHPMQHPIHFHGQKFVVLSRNGIPEENMVWKDTTLLKVGESVDLLIKMVNPGIWMAHCHISEHMHSGMMFSFSVTPTGGLDVGMPGGHSM